MTDLLEAAQSTQHGMTLDAPRNASFTRDDWQHAGISGVLASFRGWLAASPKAIFRREHALSSGTPEASSHADGRSIRRLAGARDGARKADGGFDLGESRPESVTIRDAVETDLTAVNSIAVSSKAYWGYPAEWLEQWRGALTITPADLSRMSVRVATATEGHCLGLVATMAANPRWTLEHLWVHPRCMGRGVGRALLRDALLRAREAGAIGLDIEADPHAASFYLRFGARTAGCVPAPMPGAAERVLPRLWLDVEHHTSRG